MKEYGEHYNFDSALKVLDDIKHILNEEVS